MITDPTLLSFLTALFVIIIGTALVGKFSKMRRNEWEHIVKPELQEVRDDNNSFYQRRIRGIVEENEGLYQSLLSILGINESEVRLKLAKANWSRFKAEELIALRVSVLLIGVALSILAPILLHQFSAFAFVLLTTVVVYYYPEIKIRDMIKRRQKEIKHNLPDFLELLVVLLDVGTPIQDAIMQVADSFKDATGEEFKRAAVDARYNGGHYMGAMDELSERIDLDEVSDLVAAMGIASEKGTPLAPVLREQIHRIRFKHQQDYEEKAAKMSTRMMPVMAICIFLPMLLLLLTPAFVNMFK